MKKLFILLMMSIPVALFSQEYVNVNVDENVSVVEIVNANAQTPIYISAWAEYVGPYCAVYLSASGTVTSTITVEMRGDGGLGRFSMTIPYGSSSAQQMFYVPGDTYVEIENISPSSDAYHYYY